MTLKKQMKKLYNENIKILKKKLMKKLDYGKIANVYGSRGLIL